MASRPLFERVARKYPIYRALDIVVLLFLISLLVYRFFSLESNHGFAWLLALLCESCFTLLWVLTISTKWSPVEFKTYPERLSNRMEDLPPVDMFVTTADPLLEPPIMTVNTVISLMAVDYPAHKLACYVSDDSCSAVTFYSLVEALKFAKYWVPFCKKYNVQLRAPFRYFSTELCTPSGVTSLKFQQEYQQIKDEYEELSRKIEDASKTSTTCDLRGDLSIFSNTKRSNHPTIIKVLWENKGLPNSDGLPHLIYISREKSPKHPHHYKAGAMNVLSRVSGLITNAPFMLNVDCDMFVNNPQIVRHAMCLVMGSKNEKDCAFVQSPQYFYDGLKDDPYGNQLGVLHEYLGHGMAGIQGPIYAGTGCFHRRKIIYGLCPDDMGNRAENLTPVNVNLTERELLKGFGNSTEFIKSAARTLQGKKNSSSKNNLSDLVEVAHLVAGCGYEYGTLWGTEVGWQYGSATEDVLTSLTIHSKGWTSVYCTPDPPAFLGCAPSTWPATMIQQKRWATGLLEILIGKRSPVLATLNAKLLFRQCLAYLWILVWGLRSIPELCYVVLPAYCIITNSNFMPKIGDPTTYAYVALFLTYNLYTLLEYLQTGLSVRAWWNNQRATRITAINAWLFSILSVILKVLGISETVFEVTQKDQPSSSNDGGDAGRFTFDGSALFVPGTTLVLVQLIALVVGFSRLHPLVTDGNGSGLGEMVCSVLVVICFWPFVEGLFGKGKYGIPFFTICKSALLALFFVYFCMGTSMD